MNADNQLTLGTELHAEQADEQTELHASRISCRTISAFSQTSSTVSSDGGWWRRVFNCLAIALIPLATVSLFSIFWWAFFDLYPSAWNPLPQARDLPYCPYRSVLYTLRFRYSGELDDEECFDPFCGLVQPSKASNSTVRYFSGSDRNVSSHANLTFACWSIIEFDIANRTTAAECVDWCNQQAQELKWPSLHCYSRKQGGNVVRTACVKARVANFFDFIPETVRPFVPYMAGAIYILPGLAIAMFMCKTSISDAGDEVWDDDGEQEVETLLHDPHQGPDKEKLSLQGPFPEGIGFPWCVLPWCFPVMFPVESDQQRSILMLWTRIPGMLLESFLDVTSFVSYLLYGEPIYATCVLITMAAVWDLFQIKSLQSLRKSIERGFETKDYWQVTAREGVLDGGVGAYLAIHSCMQASAMESAPWAFLFVRLLSIFYGLMRVVPKGTEAGYLLSRVDRSLPHEDEPSECRLNINSYYEVVQARRELPSHVKYFATNGIVFAAMVGFLAPELGFGLCLFILFAASRHVVVAVYREYALVVGIPALAYVWFIYIIVLIMNLALPNSPLDSESLPSWKDIKGLNVIAIVKSVIVLCGAAWLVFSTRAHVAGLVTWLVEEEKGEEFSHDVDA